MVKNCYEFEVQLIVNGALVNEIKKVRIMGNEFEECENKLYDHFKKMKNVKVAGCYYVQNFIVIE